MNLQEIKKNILSLPTILDISEGIFIINKLMSVDVGDLIKNKDDLRFIIKSLELSHTDSGFMELTKDNEDLFIKLHHWLNKINAQFNINLNSNTIDSFNLTFEDFNKLMS